MMATLRNLLCLLLIAVHGHCSSETLVPFIAWSNSDDLSSLSSKQPSTVKDFLRNTELLDVQYFIVFKISKLSFDDIAKFGGVYGEKHSALASLQSSLQSAKSSLWTGMHGQPATNLVSSLSFNYDIDEQHVSGADDISLDQNSKQLFVVVLPEGDSEERVFLEQDKLISQVMATVSQSKKRYIAFYTADHSSSQKPHIQVFESRREAPAYFYNNYMDDNSNATGTVCALMDNGTSTANGGRCAMMCLKTPIYLVDLTSSGKIHMVNDTAESIRFIDGSCLRSNETQLKCDSDVAPYLLAEATFNNSGSVLFKFTFKQGTSSNCTVSTGYWTIDMEVDGEKYVRNTRTKIFSKFEIPTGASYACGNNSHNVFHVYTPPGNNTAVENQNVTSAYMFSGLQAQVGGVFTETSFASSYNCESYFSHVSLMGVFSVVVLLVVLYCSVVFMFQMKSMDRFDDPRGPTITVENLH